MGRLRPPTLRLPPSPPRDGADQAAPATGGRRGPDPRATPPGTVRPHLAARPRHQRAILGWGARQRKEDRPGRRAIPRCQGNSATALRTPSETRPEEGPRPSRRSASRRPRGSTGAESGLPAPPLDIEGSRRGGCKAKSRARPREPSRSRRARPDKARATTAVELASAGASPAVALQGRGAGGSRRSGESDLHITVLSGMWRDQRTPKEDGNEVPLSGVRLDG